METLDELLRQAEVAHGHLCAGQILGVRMARMACRMLGVEEPRGADRKRLVCFVEIDRCATDAIGLVTGCRLGRRALKFRDWGKMAATFVDLASGRALRVVALESSRELARERFPGVEPAAAQQKLAYRVLTDEELFAGQWVRVELQPEEMPGYRGGRVRCAECGEGVNFGRYERQIAADGSERLLCRSCACPELRYWRAVDKTVERA
jgi:formylmethanofuran dehydrogenase subunit E